MLASFVKRLSRLSLTAPPAALVVLIPFTYNVLKRHPPLMVMIHNADDPSDLGGKSAATARSPCSIRFLSASPIGPPSPPLFLLLADPYDPASASPFATNALSSSLWELASLTRHYHASVSSLAKILQESFRKERYGLEDFLDQSYSTVSAPSCRGRRLPIHWLLVMVQLFRSELRKNLKYDPPLRDSLTVASEENSYEGWDLT
jgi:U3 small nucleolar RNA-associated protein 19